jgi:hypothetical protein
VFGQLAEDWVSKLREGLGLFAIGEPNADKDGRYAIKADQLLPAANARSALTGGVCVTLKTTECQEELLGSISTVALEHHGQTPLYFKIVDEAGNQVELLEAAAAFRVSADKTFEEKLTKLVSTDRLEYASK